MAEDLVAAAFNDAVNKANAASQEKMGAATAGMPLPPGMRIRTGTERARAGSSQTASHTVIGSAACAAAGMAIRQSNSQRT